MQNRAASVALQSDLKHASDQLEVDGSRLGAYPASIDEADGGKGLEKSDGTTFQYTGPSGSNTYCLTATSSRSGVLGYMVSNDNTTPREGVCSGHTPPSGGGGTGPIADGSPIQAITAANCPTTRTRAVDARDNHTYWVKKLADGKCWMLTNLAYAGGGTSTYGDVKTLSNGTSDSTYTFTEAKYYIPSGANPTVSPTNPSTSTSGSGQYGYFYNWCAAMGGQATAACAAATTPAPNTGVSVCPSGWRLPTKEEFGALNTAINGSTSTDAGLRSGWLGQWSGYWSSGSGFVGQGLLGYYWSSSQSATAAAHVLYHENSYVFPSQGAGKNGGSAVRCVAS